MSRALTSAQIIALGEYLNPGFDPSSLTVSQLLGILGYHNVKYPTPYTKPKLVQAFLDDIAPNAARLRKQRIKQENSAPSDDGITDGITGMPINGAPKPRRTSRRSSRSAVEDKGLQLARPEPPKRRRSSAQPSLGGPSRTKGISEKAPIMEESDADEEMPVRKVARSKKTSKVEGSSERRISLAEDSGWEDNNIFQSGAEDSPTKPPPVRRSSAPRTSRYSMSAPPQSPVKSPHKAHDSLARPPVAARFEPQLSPRLPKPNFGEPLITFQPQVEDNANQAELLKPTLEESILDEHPVQGEIELDDIVSVENQDAQSSTSIQSTRESDHAIVRRRSAPPIRSKPSSKILMSVYWLGLALALWCMREYSSQSAAFGFCDTGSQTNSAVMEFQARLAAIEACNRENRTHLHSDRSATEGDTPCPPLSLLPQPMACTPCPLHAKCTQHSVICDSGYLLRPHPVLRFFSPFGSGLPTLVDRVGHVADGLPGLGPVAFPPQCIEDPKRKRNIGALGKAIESHLARERGRRLCAGQKVLRDNVSDKEGGEARKWGFEEGRLQEEMKRKLPPKLLNTYDEMFDNAVQQLVQWGGVILGEDSSGKRYLAHTIPTLTWNCKVTVKLREAWEAWRSHVIGYSLGIAALFTVYIRYNRKKSHKARVAELASVVLDTLRNQELAHHTDPVTAPQPYLPSLQMRDLLLQDRGISTREKLWTDVEKKVEENANVRASLAEVRGGDELRVWTWIGTTGRPQIRES